MRSIVVYKVVHARDFVSFELVDFDSIFQATITCGVVVLQESYLFISVSVLIQPQLLVMFRRISFLLSFLDEACIFSNVKLPVMFGAYL